MLHATFDYPEDDDYWNSIFNDRVLDPKSWIHTAAELACTLNYLRAPAIDFFKSVRSAKGQALLMSTQVHGCYLMIAGFVAENLLKAIIANTEASRGPVDPTAFLEKIKKHDLPNLAGMAGMPVTPAGSELLQRLTYFAVWAGRYPTPVRVAHLKPQAISGADPNTLNYVRGSDIRATDELFSYGEKVLGIPPLIALDAKGYGDQLEDWEAVLMHRSVRTWAT